MRGAGWIDSIGRQCHNTNDYRPRHLRRPPGTGRWQPGSPDWTIDVGGTLQYLNVANSQYVTSAHDTLKRGPHIPEPIDNDFREVGATIQGHVGSLRLLSATSYVGHDVSYTLDASDAAAQFGLSGQAQFRDDSIYSIVNQELRVSPESGGRWIAGLSYMRAHSHSDGVVSDTVGTVLPVQTLLTAIGHRICRIRRRDARDRTTGRRQTAAGIRSYRTIAPRGRGDRSPDKRPCRPHQCKTAFMGLAQAVSLSWRPSAGKIIYLRYARALRPGGLAPDGPSGPQRFAS